MCFIYFSLFSNVVITIPRYLVVLSIIGLRCISLVICRLKFTQPICEDAIFCNFIFCRSVSYHCNYIKKKMLILKRHRNSVGGPSTIGSLFFIVVEIALILILFCCSTTSVSSDFLFCHFILPCV